MSNNVRKGYSTLGGLAAGEVNSSQQMSLHRKLSEAHNSRASDAPEPVTLKKIDTMLSQLTEMAKELNKKSYAIEYRLTGDSRPTDPPDDKTQISWDGLFPAMLQVLQGIRGELMMADSALCRIDHEITNQ